ncbi:helix-turn-helix transcriptional regulator [Frigoribacterium faeni]|uniref:helix-turn-helix transcriptional regulator n=1 Tax=Frigoribacterium faeni TaxID=145483 RepID=UPI0024136340|nr:helix-turn-helix transcriptional regulator [Frigoribacterium faeni]
MRNKDGAAGMKLQTPSDLARLIKNARVQQSLTQHDVAHAVGITRQSLARLERGNGGTSFDTVLLILDHLGIHLNAATDRDTAALATDATRGAAQAAADALTKRITTLIGSGTLEAISKPFLGSLPQIDPSLLLTITASDLPGQVGADLDAATLASVREASRELTERLAVPGSVLIRPPREMDARAPSTTKALTTTGPDAEGGTR